MEILGKGSELVECRGWDRHHILGFHPCQVMDKEQRDPEFIKVDIQCLQRLDDWFICHELFFGKRNSRHVQPSVPMQYDKITRTSSIDLMFRSVFIDFICREHPIPDMMNIFVNIHNADSLRLFQRYEIFLKIFAKLLGFMLNILYLCTSIHR